MFADLADIGQSETRKRKETLFRISYMVLVVHGKKIVPDPKWKYSIYRQKQIGIHYAIQTAPLAI